MKLTILISLVLLVSCGKSGSSNTPNVVSNQCENFNYIGQWNDRNSAATLMINSNCTLSEDRCQSSGTYQVINDNSFTMTITSTNGAQNCLAIGTYNCGHGWSSDNYLRVTCTQFSDLLEYDRIN